MKAGANVTNKISELSYNFAKIYNTCWLKISLDLNHLINAQQFYNFYSFLLGINVRSSFR